MGRRLRIEQDAIDRLAPAIERRMAALGRGSTQLARHGGPEYTRLQRILRRESGLYDSDVLDRVDPGLDWEEGSCARILEGQATDGTPLPAAEPEEEAHATPPGVDYSYAIEFGSAEIFNYLFENMGRDRLAFLNFIMEVARYHGETVPPSATSDDEVLAYNARIALGSRDEFIRAAIAGMGLRAKRSPRPSERRESDDDPPLLGAGV